MAYATISDVFKRYPMVANVVGSGSNLIASADVASIYISDSESIVNAFLTNRYVVPLNVEPMVTWITSDIAIYRMFEDKLPRFPEAVEKRYTNAMSLLWGLQNGDLALTTSSQALNTQGDNEAWSTANSNAGPIFVEAERITNSRSIFDPLFELDRC